MSFLPTLAISLRVQPLKEIWSNFADFAYCTKMLLAPSNMDGFQILKILLVAVIKDYHIMLTKSFYMPLDSGLGSIYPDFSLKNPLYATSKLQESHLTPDAGTFDHTT